MTTPTTPANPLITHIEEKLKAALQATHVSTIDNSWMHAGHASNPTGGSHLVITLVSDAFDGQNLLTRHRTIHKLIQDEMATHIHALELKLFTTAEWAAENQCG